MKFGTGSNVERTQKYRGSKYKMTYVRPNKHPRFSIVLSNSSVMRTSDDVLEHKWRASLKLHYC